jgi:UDP-2-acetamido-3-amino-2,3-dideoxy-glucuronate N-acetyltransferase
VGDLARALAAGGRGDAGRVAVSEGGFFAHASACVDAPCSIGAGTHIWHFCHVMAGARIGRGCVLGQNVFIAATAVIGDGVRIQNNVSVYDGTVIDDDVFLGPSAVLTNIENPRAQIRRRSLYAPTHIRRGATVGANATVVAGVTVGRYAFIAAGAVVTRDVPDYALIMGVPGRAAGFMSRHGQRLTPARRAAEGILVCPESGYRYELRDGKVRCLDLDEDAPLPPEQAVGATPYAALRAKGTAP